MTEKQWLILCRFMLLVVKVLLFPADSINMHRPAWDNLIDLQKQLEAQLKQ